MPGRPLPAAISYLSAHHSHTIDHGCDGGSPSATAADSSNSTPLPLPPPPTPPIINRFQPILDRFDHITKNAASIQADLLRSIVRANASCKYLRRFEALQALASDTHDDSESMSDADYCDAFKAAVPLISHADIMPYIDKIVQYGNDGEGRELLTTAPVQGLCLSSGTTNAKAKYLLYHDGLKQGTLEVASVAAAFRERVLPVDEGARIVEFLFCGRLAETGGGLTAGTASTLMIRSEAFRERQRRGGLRPCSPEAVVLAAAECRQTMYCHLLAGLVHARGDVQVFSAPFAFTLAEALRTLEAEWRRLCRDIRTGTLDAERVTDPALRAAVAEHVLPRPDPALARHVTSICRRLARPGPAAAAWKGVIPALWPRCRLVLSILTGAMEAYVDKLRFYAGNVPLVSADYAATEGWIGVNVNPTSPPRHVSFTVLPTLAFFEFIPLTRPASPCSSSSCCNGAHHHPPLVAAAASSSTSSSSNSTSSSSNSTSSSSSSAGHNVICRSSSSSSSCSSNDDDDDDDAISSNRSSSNDEHNNVVDSSSCCCDKLRSAALAAYEEGAPVGLTDVKLGQEYEIVMTTAWGLYRYRLGDIVRVTGFCNAAPQLAYVCRKNVMLSLNIDKVTEKDLKAAVDEGARRLAEASGSTMELVDYTSYADRTTTPGHYVVFWEVQGGEMNLHNQQQRQQQQQQQQQAAMAAEGGGAAAAAAGAIAGRRTVHNQQLQDEGKIDAKLSQLLKKTQQKHQSTAAMENESELLQQQQQNHHHHQQQQQQAAKESEMAQEVLAECAELLDRSFAEAGYVTSRKMGTIGALELCVVRRGTFSRLVDHFMRRSGAAITQYKTPRCVVAADALSLLRSSAIASLFSPA